MRELLLEAISNHLKQYMDHLNSLGHIAPEEESIDKITEYMIKAKSFMFNIMQLKKKIFSIIMPMTTMILINSKTKKEIKRTSIDHPIKKIGLLPFETRIDEIALLCEDGVKSIDSWFNHLKSRKVQYLEVVVNQSKAQAAQEQAKAAKLTFRIQLGFMILSVFFIIVSFCLSEYKKDWIDFFKNIQSVQKTSVKESVKIKQPPTDNNINNTQKKLPPNKL